MKKRNRYLLWIPVYTGLLLLQWACQDKALDEPVKDPVSAENDLYRDGIKKGVLHVKFKSSPEISNALMSRSGSPLIGVKSVDEVTAGLGEVKMERLFPPAGKNEKKHQKYGLDLWYRVEFDKDVDLTRLTRSYSNSDVIECVETVKEMKLFANDRPFNDPGLALQWHYDVNDLTKPLPDANIGLYKAWQVTTGSPDVIVAIIDEGVDHDHPDLAANMWINEAEKNGKTGADDDNNGYKDDVYGFNFVDGRGRIKKGKHGTHVAGTVGAVNNNGIGVCGVAGGDGSGNGVRMMVCQISDGSIFLNDAEAIIYAADNGAVIAQCSWGFTGPINNALREAIDYFVAEAGCDENGKQVGPMKGGVLCVAAGNDNKKNPVISPASYGKVIAVAASTSQKTRARYSNYADWVDISAPGGDGDDQDLTREVYSTILDGGYGYASGTSMACPHVSGIAALVVSVKGGPGFTNEMLTKRLYESTIPLSENEPDVALMGHGLLHADMAVWDDDKAAPLPVTDLRVKETEDGIALEWTITADPNDRQAYSFDVYTGSSPLNSGNVASATRVTVKTGAKKAGETIRHLLPLESGNVSRYYAVVAVDLWGNRADISNVTSFDWTNDGVAPEQVTDLVLVKAGDGYALEWAVTADKNDGAALSYILYMSKSSLESGKTDGVETVVIPVAGKKVGEKMRYVLNLPDNVGSYYFGVKGKDRWGNVSVLSNVIGGSQAGSAELKVYPNPVVKTVNVNWGDGFTGEKTVSIYDMAGRQVFKQSVGDKSGSGIAALDLSSLAAGKYVLKLSSDGATKTSHIVKR